MEINEYHGDYNIGDRTEPVRYIVCHYVGNGDSSPGSALANCRYFAGGDRGASANYFVDDGGIWEYADPSEYYTWHCGDGHGAYGITNRNSIGIEVCIDGDTPYTDDEIGYMCELVPYLMDRFGVPAENVVRHYDASRKACPYYYTPYGSGGDEAWSELWAIMTSGTAPQPEPERKVDDLQYVYNGGGDVYRLYNPNGGKHFFTLSGGERDNLVNSGWSDEGVAWTAPRSAEIPVYRMYNPGNGDHFFTQDFGTCRDLQDAGWAYEGVPFFTNRDGRPVFRLYNPNSGEHFYTASEAERNNLQFAGWDYEGVAFNAE